MSAREGRNSRNCGTQTSARSGRLSARDSGRLSARESGRLSARDSGRLSARSKGVQVGTYPETYPDPMQRKAEAGGCKKKDSFPKYHTTENDVYLFIRGKRELIQRLKNAFVREKRILANYHGCYLGCAGQVKRFEGDTYNKMPESTVVVIRFDDEAEAIRWTQSSPNFKQQDFPTPSDELEMFTVPVKYVPDEDLRAFQLTEMRGVMASNQEFYDNFQCPVAKAMDRCRIYHGLAATKKVNRVRNCMLQPDTFVLVNCADSESKLESFFKSPEYQDKQCWVRGHVGATDTCLFTLDQ